MKKIFTILSLAFAFAVVSNTANAQSATATTKESKVAPSNQKATDLKSETEGKSATRVAAPAEDKNAMVQKQISDYERKIEANRNNPNFDLKAAEAELARMKKEAGLK